MIIKIGKDCFKGYLDSFKNTTAVAYSWPTSIFDEEIRKDIAKYPGKYVNWLIWILQTAPRPKSEQDNMSRSYIKNTLADILEVDGSCDYLEELKW